MGTAWWCALTLRASLEGPLTVATGALSERRNAARRIELCVVAQLFADNKALSLPYRTRYRSFKRNVQWAQWFQLPFRVCDLPLDAQLVFTVYALRSGGSAVDAHDRIVGGTTLPLFGTMGYVGKGAHTDASSLRRGLQRLWVWRGVSGDAGEPTQTPHSCRSNTQMATLERRIKEQQRGGIATDAWLDKLLYRRMERVHAAELAASQDLLLYVGLPSYDVPIVFSEPEPPTAEPPRPPAATAPAAAPFDASIFTIVDPDAEGENIVEAKHRRIARGQRTGLQDRERKPTAAVRDELNVRRRGGVC